MYRIYIEDREVRLYLMDWFVSIGVDHPQFTTKRDYAMLFVRFNAALRYHERPRKAGIYAAHRVVDGESLEHSCNGLVAEGYSP